MQNAKSSSCDRAYHSVTMLQVEGVICQQQHLKVADGAVRV